MCGRFEASHKLASLPPWGICSPAGAQLRAGCDVGKKRKARRACRSAIRLGFANLRRLWCVQKTNAPYKVPDEMIRNFAPPRGIFHEPQPCFTKLRLKLGPFQ